MNLGGRTKDRTCVCMHVCVCVVSVTGCWCVFTGYRNVFFSGDSDEIRAGFDLVKMPSLYESSAPSVSSLYGLCSAKKLWKYLTIALRGK